MQEGHIQNMNERQRLFFLLMLTPPPFNVQAHCLHGFFPWFSKEKKSNGHKGMCFPYIQGFCIWGNGTLAIYGRGKKRVY